jgi:phosphotransferase system enzyme I (PtsI)
MAEINTGSAGLTGETAASKAAGVSSGQTAANEAAAAVARIAAITQVIRGIGVSAGSAVGPAVIIGDPPTVPVDEPACLDADADWTRVAAAIEHVATELERKATAIGGSAAEILAATAMMARDRSLAKGIKKSLAVGEGPAGSVHAAIEDVCATFSSLGGYLAERTTDLRDVGSRVIARLLGLPEPGVPELTVPSILVARDLAPADTAGLSPATTLAIVTEHGGPTSHTAILAAQLGIPAVVHAAGALTIAAGILLAVDGSTGTVTVAPDADIEAQLAHRRERRANLLSSTSGPGTTLDGHKVKLYANIGTAADAKKSAAVDLEGVGLFRTEFLFLERATAPTIADQTQTYTTVFEAFGDRTVVVRTLDAGADKPLAFADLGPEENPALGRRGLRLSMERVELLDHQLAALAAAANTTGADVRVMAPMVATPAEAHWFAERVKAHGLPMSGVMVEVPAAALRATQILAEVDFVSIGTNDLAQYTMAADRMQGELAALLDPWQPAVLELIGQTATAATSQSKPVGVCGESAGDPLLALVLVGLGITSLSMASSKVSAVRYALAQHDLATCQQIAQAARYADSPEAGRAAVRELAVPELLDIL